VREPDGKLVRHVFHTNVPASTTIGERATVYPPQDGFPSSSLSSYSNSSAPLEHPRTSKSTATSQTASNDGYSTIGERRSNVSTNFPYSSQKLRSSITSSSPPHPTVQSTADFLRANSSLDTSYCPNETDVPRSSLVQYVSWDSDIAKVHSPSKSDMESKPEESSSTLTRGVPTIATSSAPSYPSLEPSPTEPKATSETQEKSSNNVVRTIQDGHQPSKALKYHLAHGGDKGLIDVANPYDEL